MTTPRYSDLLTAWRLEFYTTQSRATSTHRSEIVTTARDCSRRRLHGHHMHMHTLLSQVVMRLPVGEWSHVACTWNGGVNSGMLTAYRNGKRVDFVQIDIPTEELVIQVRVTYVTCVMYVTGRELVIRATA